MWQRCQQYMPHVQKSVSLIEEWKIVSPEAARLLEQTGMYLQIQAQFTQAFAHFERASDMHRLLVETEPLITIAAHIYLFRHYYYQGKYVQADQPIRKALRLVEQTPGSEALTKAICFGPLSMNGTKNTTLRKLDEEIQIDWVSGMLLEPLREPCIAGKRRRVR